VVVVVVVVVVAVVVGPVSLSVLSALVVVVLAAVFVVVVLVVVTFLVVVAVAPTLVSSVSSPPSLQSVQPLSHCATPLFTSLALQMVNSPMGNSHGPRPESHSWPYETTGQPTSLNGQVSPDQNRNL
jgi:hypothetical protein